MRNKTNMLEKLARLLVGETNRKTNNLMCERTILRLNSKQTLVLHINSTIRAIPTDQTKHNNNRKTKIAIPPLLLMKNPPMKWNNSINITPLPVKKMQAMTTVTLKSLSSR